MKNKVLLINIFASILLFMTLFSVNDSNINYIKYLDIVAVFSLITIVLFVYSIYKLEKSIVNLFLIFELFLVIFNFGQFIAFYLCGNDFSVLTPYRNSLTAFPESIVKSTVNMCFLYIYSFHFGWLFFSKNIKKRNTQVVFNLITAKYIGLALLLISIVPLIKYDSAYFVQSIKYGYVLSDLSVNYGIIDDLARLYKVAVIFLIIGYSKEKKVKFIVLGNIIYSFLKIWLIGQRGYEFIFVIFIAVIYYTFIAKINFKKMIMLFVVVLFSLSLMKSVVYTRDSTQKVNFSSVVSNVVKDNIVVETLAEFGNTFYTAQIINYEVPNNVDFCYGKEFFMSTLTMLPNIGGLSNKLKEVNLIYQMSITQYRGIGGSMIGEFYYNFGWLGFIFMFAFGDLCAKLSRKISFDEKIDSVQAALYIALFQNLIWFIRDSIMSLPRKCLFELILPYILYLIIKKVFVVKVHSENKKKYIEEKI
ncbi:O-antigen polymerase [Longibaculum muris]|uniref:Oligosaccharide repeat unit polymerase n=1 Tax=Longibaculum muris TaxID=1796628 RepID=A0A4R3Z860_9FIRM|nr:O-antigen polymerase [Longibaculum muris]KXU51591.1 hypothetical protein HMPREF3037_00956 [Candidatus Stoquefichus sp. KLE1796]MBS5370709.1 O-antigen polysaccharide polymerase Wzy [Coprobacillus cateniformis]MCR1886864.1 oligosaccharide repeat unit polymerase [Longibaculum muris]MED9813306.1 O-antigen polymerase [Longibaculum muris]TCW02894.1 oligosaccharide repeat unit polymerase [Longibaculum muris]